MTNMFMPHFSNGLAPFFQWTCPIFPMDLPHFFNGLECLLHFSCGVAPFFQWTCPIFLMDLSVCSIFLVGLLHFSCGVAPFFLWTCSLNPDRTPLLCITNALVVAVALVGHLPWRLEFSDALDVSFHACFAIWASCDLCDALTGTGVAH